MKRVFIIFFPVFLICCSNDTPKNGPYNVAEDATVILSGTDFFTEYEKWVWPRYIYTGPSVDDIGSSADDIGPSVDDIILWPQNRDYPTTYGDYKASFPGGSPYSDKLKNSIVDGKFLKEGTRWNEDTLWWDAHYAEESTGFDPISRTVFNKIDPSKKGYITIELGGLFSIDSFILQADNNDEYRISYLDNGSSEWTTFEATSEGGMRTRPEIALPNPIITSAFMIEAISGDGWYSISEVQAMGVPVP